MCGMNRIVRSAILIAFAMAAAAPLAVAQSGSIEFTARATPSGGLEEQVRGFPFFLLSRSYESITQEVVASYPMPDMDAFIDKLEVSKELKAWMKKNRWVKLSGEDFIQKVHSGDILEVAEFRAAYMQRNDEGQYTDFPKPKAKASDKVKDPAKFERQTKEYDDAVRHFIEQNPTSMDGMELGLVSIDPGAQWNAVLAKRLPEISRQVREMAQSKYLVGRTETDLQGQGYFRNIPPGNYWLSSLDVPANVGDARLRWDLEIAVQPGKTNYVSLSSVNAIQPGAHTAP
jgi:hypothetical protein